MRRHRSSCLASLALLAATAVSAAPAGRQRALLLGVSEYASADFRDLDFAAKDAEDLAAALLSPTAGGWTPDQVTVLTDGSVTSSAVKAALVRALKSAQTGDFVLVFFSGHGFVHEGNTYLAMTDTRVEEPEVTALDLGELRTWLSLWGSSASKLLILDACHSGAAVASSKGAKGIDYADLRASLSGLEGDTGYITSSGAGQPSQENRELRNGAFTGLFLKALAGDARNASGTVTISDAFSFVRRNLTDQKPQIGGSLPTDIVLARRSGGSAPQLPDVVVEIVPTTRVGKLKITCDVAGAVIKLDGKTLATTTGASDIKLASVAVGRHDIEVVADGYATWSSPVTVSADVEAVLDAALISYTKRDRPPEQAATPVPVAGSVERIGSLASGRSGIPGTAPKARFSEATIDFGSVERGTDLVGTWQVANDGGTDLSIDAKPG